MGMPMNNAGRHASVVLAMAAVFIIGLSLFAMHATHQIQQNPELVEGELTVNNHSYEMSFDHNVTDDAYIFWTFIGIFGVALLFYSVHMYKEEKEGKDGNE